MAAPRYRGYTRAARDGFDVPDDHIRQIVSDLLAPLSAKFDAMREELADLKRRPEQAAENRRGDILTMCAVLGTLIALTSCGNGLVGVIVAVWLHFAR